MSNKVELEISAGTDLLVKGLRDGDRAVVKFTNDVNKSFSGVKNTALNVGSSIAGAFKNSFTELAKGVAIGNLVASAIQGVAGSIRSFVGDSLQAAQKQEDAINKLSQALKANGDFTNTAVREFQAFSSELQKASKFGDEVILSQLAVAKSFGATNEQAKQLIQAAINLEATFGGTLEQRVEELGKTLNGTRGRLNQLIPEFQNLTTEQLRAGNAIDVINSKFAGAGANAVQTFSGATAQLSNAFGDLQEEIGFFITRNPAVISAIQGLTRGFELFGNSVRNVRSILGIGLDAIDEQKRKSKEIAIEINKIADEIEARKKSLAAGKFFNNVESEAVQLQKINEFEKRRSELIKERRALNAQLRDDQQKAIEIENKSRETQLTDKELQQRKQLNQQILQQQADFALQRAQIDAQNDLLEDERRLEAFDKILQFELEKIEAVRNAEIAKAELLQESGARQLAIQAANDKAKLDQQNKQAKAEVDRARFLRQQEKQEFDQRIAIANNFLNAGLALSKQNGQAQKALAITQATINTYQAATNALADTRPTFLAPAAAASIIALGLANVSRIAGAKFQRGGIVGSNSVTGDRVPAMVNSREMILNLPQQRRLFDIANGSESGGQGQVIQEIRKLAQSMRSIPIVVEANGREIARLIRDQEQSGFEVLT